MQLSSSHCAERAGTCPADSPRPRIEAKPDFGVRYAGSTLRRGLAGTFVPLLLALETLGAVSITSQPQAVQTVDVFNQVRFAVVAEGDNLRYQWYRNNTVLPGATRSALTFSSDTVIPARAGSYFVAIAPNGQVPSPPPPDRSPQPNGTIYSQNAFLTVNRGNQHIQFVPLTPRLTAILHFNSL
jgi:hypothetical protein